MKQLFKNALAVTIFSAMIVVLTIPSTKQLWAQGGPNGVWWGTTSAGVQVPIRAATDGTLTAYPNGATFSQATVTVTSGVTALSAADTDQKYWQVQNNHATGNLYVAPFSPVSSTTGVKVGPGQAWAPLIAPKDAMYGIGDVASNTAVIVTTGK